MIFGLLYFCVVILCVNRSRTSFILYRIVKRHSRQSNVRRIWTCADNGADLTKTTMAGEWRLNPRVLRAKGDRSVLERYLSATMQTCSVAE